jgi:hypothetical protein
MFKFTINSFQTNIHGDLEMSHPSGSCSVHPCLGLLLIIFLHRSKLTEGAYVYIIIILLFVTGHFLGIRVFYMYGNIFKLINHSHKYLDRWLPNLFVYDPEFEIVVALRHKI